MDYVVTVAREDDLTELSTLINSAYRGETSRAGWTTEADFLDGQRTDPLTLQADLEGGRDRVFLCLREGPGEPILGCVFLEKFNSERGPGCYLGMLTVAPKLQAQGIGRIVLESGEEYARRWGATRVGLGVIHLRSALMQWYERRGYVKTGETKPFPYGQPHFGIPKRDDLHFIMFEKML